MLADVCVIVIVAFFIYTGYRSGLMKSFVKIASYIISIVISFFLYPVIADVLVKTPLYDKLTKLIGEKYIMQNFTEPAADTFGVFAKYLGEGIQNASNGIAEAIAGLLINILAFVIVLVLSKIIIRVVGSVFNIFAKLPVIKQFNRLGGAALGGISGIVVLYIVCGVMLLFSPIDTQSRIAAEIEASTFASEIYENNIILNFIEKGNQSDN